MWENILEGGRSQMIMWRMHIARWIPKATFTLSECVVIIAFPLQQRLHERAWILPTLPVPLHFSTEIARLYFHSSGIPCFCRAA